MNFDFNVVEWDRSSQIIGGAIVLGLISLFLPWGILSGDNGLSFYGVIPWLCMGYPGYVVITRSKMNRDIGLITSAFSLGLVLYLFLGFVFQGFGSYISIGVIIYLLSAAGCVYGTYTYKTPEIKEPKVIQPVQPQPVQPQPVQPQPVQPQPVQPQPVQPQPVQPQPVQPQPVQPQPVEEQNNQQ